MATTPSERIEARNGLLTALSELGGPATFDELATYASGTHLWDRNRHQAHLYELALKALVKRGDVVQEWPRENGWRVVYRLATDVDRAAADDAAEVDRLTAEWEPA